VCGDPIAPNFMSPSAMASPVGVSPSVPGRKYTLAYRLFRFDIGHDAVTRTGTHTSHVHTTQWFLFTRSSACCCCHVCDAVTCVMLPRVMMLRVMLLCVMLPRVMWPAYDFYHAWRLVVWWEVLGFICGDIPNCGPQLWYSNAYALTGF
jgi:hypothetical protein